MFNELIINVVASAILLFFGYLYGKFRERKLHEGKNLDDYDFYPFDLDEKKHLFFDMGKFSEGVKYLLNHPDNTAARQLIIIGQQNNVENNLSAHEKEDYKNLAIIAKRSINLEK